MTSPARPHFIPGIESARGIAALCVCGMHVLMFWSAFRASPVDPRLMQFFVGSGNSAVTFFFVLSGFVLTLSLDKMKAESGSALPFRFVLARLFRIYPAVIVIVFIFATIEPWWIFRGLPDRPLSLTLKDAFLWQSTMVWPTWSTRVEIAGTPLILAAWYLRGRFGRPALVLLGSVLAAGAFARDLYASDEIGQDLFVFIVGMLLADSGPLFRRLTPRIAVPLTLVAMVIDDRARIVVGWHEQWTIVIEAACCFVIAGVIAYGSIPTRWLEMRPLRFFGRISYSFYLVHFVVLWVLLKEVPDSVQAALSLNSDTLSCLEVFAATSAISTVLAYGLYRLIERPGIAIGHGAILLGLTWRPMQLATQPPAGD
jgi:peptidoglycan/LPS O-acetylase OafA/YrhL